MRKIVLLKWEDAQNVIINDKELRSVLIRFNRRSINGITRGLWNKLKRVEPLGAEYITALRTASGNRESLILVCASDGTKALILKKLTMEVIQ